MATGQRGLGRGLDALIKSGRDVSSSSTEVRKLPVASLTPNPHQPRRHFADVQLDELAQSIKSQGVLQPILVRPLPGTEAEQYEIVAGERRWRAAQKAGLTEVPVVVRELNDRETLVLALLENLQREDLNPMEEARGMARLKEEFGMSQEDLAQKLCKSRSAIANTMRLLSLPSEAADDLAAGRISAGHARALLAVADHEAQQALRLRILHEHLSVREAEALAGSWKETGELPVASEEAPSESRAAKHDAAPVKAAASESMFLTDIQSLLSSRLEVPVRISGRETKGKISFSYNSRQELDALLARMGMERCS